MVSIQGSRTSIVREEQSNLMLFLSSSSTHTQTRMRAPAAFLRRWVVDGSVGGLVEVVAVVVVVVGGWVIQECSVLCSTV